jgi:hypothetical protein
MGTQADAEFGHCTLFGEWNHERLRGWLKRNKMPNNTKRLMKTANHGAE